ncbi:MAG: nucleotidyltransferase family protein [Arenicellales bacterium]
MNVDPVPSPQIALLRRCAVIEPDHDACTAIRDLVSDLGNWQDLISCAEKHGLSNLLHSHLQSLGIEIPDIARQQLLSLRVRHRRANQARIKAMQEIVDVLSRHQIESALLKGAALIHVLYPSPELRPMSDIDVLVHADQAQHAQQCLRDIGYFAEQQKTGYLSEHHHLPIASRSLDGISIHVEIHKDALSGDVTESIRLDSLSSPLVDFEIEGIQCWTLGHIDMLRHLCHHTLEPIEEIKLGAIADLYGYAARYRDELDIDSIDSRYPFVTNMFSLLHYVSPLPRNLRDWVAPPTAPPPRGVGYGFTPMSQIIANEKKLLSRVQKLMQAPDWWLHGYYNVPPNSSLLSTKLLHHPLRVARWLIRRIRAKSKSEP